MWLTGTVTSKHGDVVALTPALSFRNNVTGNATDHLKSVEKISALFLACHNIMPARTSATL